MFRSDVTIGRIAGIPISLSWTVAIIVWLLGTVLVTNVIPAADPALSPWLTLGFGVAGAVAFLASILFHELGHAVVAKRGGVPVQGISLWLLGGLAKLSGEADRPGLAFRIAAAGPAVSLLLGGAFWGMALALSTFSVLPGLEAVFGWLGFINILLAVFNLLPGLPLDGGRILQAGLWGLWGDRLRATVAAGRMGQFLGYGLGALAFFQIVNGGSIAALWTAGLGLFIATAAKAELQSATTRDALAGLRFTDVMSREGYSAPSYLTVDEFARDYASRFDQPVWPVRNWGGQVVGALATPRLRTVPRSQRNEARLGELATTLDELTTARPEDSVLDVLQAAGGLRGGAVLVFDGGELVGVVSGSELQRAIDRRNLAGAPRGSQPADAAV